MCDMSGFIRELKTSVDAITELNWLNTRHGEMTIVLTATALMLAIAIPRLLRPKPPIGPDAFMFEYGGWVLVNGGQPYVTFWDVKPPGVYYFTGILSLLSGGNMAVLHWLSVGVNCASVIVSCVLIIRTIGQLSDSYHGGLIGGVAFLAYPSVFALPATGFRPKFVVLAITAGSLYLYSRDRALASVTLATLAPAFWQLSAVLPLTLALFTISNRKSAALPIAYRSGIITAAVSIPIVAISGWTPVVAEVVIAPIIGSESFEPLRHVSRGRYYLRFAAPIAVLGGVELLWQAIDRENLWLLAPSVLFVLMVIFIDLDGPADLLLPYLFISVGVGLFAGRLDDSLQHIMAIGVLVLVGANILFYLSTSSPGYIPPAAGTENYSHMDIRLFWEQRFPKSCHIRLSQVERIWIEDNSGRVCK